MEMEKNMRRRGMAFSLSSRKGMVFSLSIFLLVAVLLSLMAFWVEQTDKRHQTIDAPADVDVLAARLDELGVLSTQALGISATLARNSTHVQLTVSDAGFPLSPKQAGQVDLLPLQDWLNSSWTAVTHASLSYDYSRMNASGQLLKTSASGLVYSHDNSNDQYDQAMLFSPASITPAALDVAITCKRPGGASSVAYTDWASSGTTMDGTVNFYDSGGLHISSAVFDPSSDNSFSAQYYDAGGNWMQTIHVDWVAPDALRLRGENNATYVPALDKTNVSCSWTTGILDSYPGTLEETMYVPVSVSLRYYNADYVGWLVLARK